VARVHRTDSAIHPCNGAIGRARSNRRWAGTPWASHRRSWALAPWSTGCCGVRRQPKRQLLRWSVLGWGVVSLVGAFSPSGSSCSAPGSCSVRPWHQLDRALPCYGRLLSPRRAGTDLGLHLERGARRCRIRLPRVRRRGGRRQRRWPRGHPRGGRRERGTLGDFFLVAAPTLFGWVADRFAHRASNGVLLGSAGGISISSTHGIADTFLVMLALSCWPCHAGLVMLALSCWPCHAGPPRCQRPCHRRGEGRADDRGHTITQPSPRRTRPGPARRVSPQLASASTVEASYHRACSHPGVACYDRSPRINALARGRGSL